MLSSLFWHYVRKIVVDYSLKPYVLPYKSFSSQTAEKKDYKIKVI